MRGAGALLGLCATLVAAAALAAAPDRSIRPEPRPSGAAAPVDVPVFFGSEVRPRPRSDWTPDRVLSVLPATAAAAAVTQAAGPTSTPASPGVRVYFTAETRPKPRPWLARTRAPGSVAPPPLPLVRQLASSAPVYRSPRPLARPQNLQRRNTVVRTGLAAAVTPRATGREGAICGNRAIRGHTLAPIAGTLRGCGIADPVQVTEVGGVRLSTPATMDCTTAQALLSWTERGAKPAVGRLGGGIAEYRVAAHYACRTRNSQPGARISEHGKGRAIDISAIRLANGVDITLLNGWGDRTQGPILRRMWQAACGPFGTVLGPESNRFHRDHFHFDTARYRSGPYCR